MAARRYLFDCLGASPSAHSKGLPPKTTDEISEGGNFVAFRVPANPFSVCTRRSRRRAGSSGAASQPKRRYRDVTEFRDIKIITDLEQGTSREVRIQTTLQQTTNQVQCIRRGQDKFLELLLAQSSRNAPQLRAFRHLDPQRKGSLYRNQAIAPDFHNFRTLPVDPTRVETRNQ